MASREIAKPSVREVLSWAEEDHVGFVNIQFTDITGGLKAVTLPVGELDEALTNGIWFDGSSIDGFARIAESDMFLMPDRSTYGVIPWEEGAHRTARLIGDVFTPSGATFTGDPRAVLQRQLDRLAALGYGYNTGPEVEFFLFQTEGGRIAPLPYDRASYFDVSADVASRVRKDMVLTLTELGIIVEQAHHEVAGGQHEIDFRYGNALATADHVITFKYAIKEVAQRHGLLATFMPKPVEGISGSGMHVHQSFCRLDDGGNAFVDERDDFGLSTVARQFIAGQLHHARGMAAVLAPISNSYQRLVAGYEAPVYISWARTNRSALIRVPAVRPHKAQSTRVELRCPDPSCNPYLAFAVMLASGIDGIERGLSLPKPVEENLYDCTPEELKAQGVGSLPGTLGEAIEELEQDEVVCEALGDHICSRLVEAQQRDWDAARQHVGEWARARYLQVC
ncbi:MAG TPA: type I glutamate--ammonia ligase [Thermomicrobiaceae bacterium]|nr:type I glutamate--ammonia ligase [Thermomicrobiaceae bacterium]